MFPALAVGVLVVVARARVRFKRAFKRAVSTRSSVISRRPTDGPT
jgi:hypothetical protein